MDGAAGGIALQPHQGEALGHDALSGEGGIPVQQDAHHLPATGLGIVPQVEGLLRPGLAQHHRIDDLQVAGIGGEAEVHAVAVERPVRAGPQVVLHVAGALDVRRRGRTSLELVQDGAIGLAHDGGQDVQAAPVGHAQHDLVHAQGAAALDDLLHGRDQALAPVQAEALGAGEALVQEALPGLGLDQLLQDRLLALGGEGDFLVLALDALLDPALLVGVGDVHELHAHIAAVGAAQDGHDLPQGGGLEAQHVVDEDRPVPVGLGEAVEAGLQLRIVGLGLQAQGVEIGVQVPPDPEGPDHHDGPDAVEGGGADLGLGGLGIGGGDADAGLGGHRLGPLAVQGGQPFRPVLRHGGIGPGGFGAELGYGLGVFPQGVEEGPPAGGDVARVLGVAGVEVLDIGEIAPIEEGSLRQDLIDPSGIVRHLFRSLADGPAAMVNEAQGPSAE